MRPYVEREKPDDLKAKELILYIAEKSLGDKPFGSVKLNKLLYYSDFFWYAKTGRAITSQHYTAENQGPVMELMPKFTRQLEGDGSAFIEEVSYYGKPQKRLTAKRKPDLSLFTPEEIAFVDEIVARFWDLNAKALTKITHRQAGYLATEKGSVIPYETIFVSDRDLTTVEFERGNEIA